MLIRYASSKETDAFLWSIKERGVLGEAAAALDESHLKLEGLFPIDVEGLKEVCIAFDMLSREREREREREMSKET
jgi:hypothetical protein